MCNLSWTPHSNLEKDNSLKTTPVLAHRWAVWSIHPVLTKLGWLFFYDRLLQIWQHSAEFFRGDLFESFYVGSK